MRLVADRLEARDAPFQRRVVEIGNARLDSVIEPFETQIGLRGALVQLRDMFAAALGAFLPTVENGRQNFLEPLRLEQSIRAVLGDKAVQLLHRNRAAFAAGLAPPRFDRAGVVAIPPSLPGPERHGAAAVGTEADAGKEGRAAHDARRRDLRIARPQMRLYGVKHRLVDDRWHVNRDDLAYRLKRLVLGALVELVAADIGRSRQDAVDLPDAPAPAIAREDAMLVEISRDVLDTHRAVRAVAFQGEPIDQPNRIRVQRIDFQLLLDLRSALLGRDDAIADGWRGAVPEALPRGLFQGAQDVLGVFLRLILVEQRHDLPHHDVHRIVAHLLSNRGEPDAVLGELPDVELQLEVVAEEAREAVDDDDIEWRGPARARLDHALELGPAVVGGGGARLDIGLDDLIAA
ncbi:MAG TPA: hypothetical protein VLX85_01060 [Stellaceae bacterium]|nr:hypothetical protein [Stellaceae bacterium]